MNPATDLLTEIEGGIAWVTLNRPQTLNAFSPAMRDEFIRFMRQIESDAAVRCVVLRGAGGNFMAGGDVKSFAEQFAQPPEARRALFEGLCHAMNPMIYLMRRLGKPIVASVEGACAGLGLSLVLASDFALAADNAVFTLAYSRIGTTPDGGASYFLPRLVGMRRAMEIAVLSDRFDAAAAERCGIVNRVVARDAVGAETLALATRLAAGATQAIGRTKALLNGAFGHDLESQLQLEALNFAACAMTDDMVEGVSAFVEKRKPKFVNR